MLQFRPYTNILQKYNNNTQSKKTRCVTSSRGGGDIEKDWPIPIEIHRQLAKGEIEFVRSHGKLPQSTEKRIAGNDKIGEDVGHEPMHKLEKNAVQASMFKPRHATKIRPAFKTKGANKFSFMNKLGQSKKVKFGP